MPEIFGREAPAFPTRAVIARQALARYGSGYVRLLAHPLDLLAGQLWALFAVSVYVQLAEMGQTTEYGVAWLGAGRLLMNCGHAVLFCAQELGLFTVLWVGVLLWQHWGPAAGTHWRYASGVVALAVLPLLSAIEVLEIAHFKLFLAPLGPEELRLVSWTGQIVTAGDQVLCAPEIIA